MKKKINSANEYLLGKDSEGDLYYLQAPSWDCDWYWGFGYIEGYSPSHRWQSHEHADKFMSEWFTEWNGSKPRLVETTFTEKEGWELSELFAQFYHLKEQAEFYGRGKMHVANTSIKSWENKTLAKQINEEMIPVVTARILKILTPEKH